ncbi:MAG: GHKL domain-containing protein, partial [Lachnospiraceae bacterium]|nr:GHKL domain-containing protein [Lachnospiraceae bacterium]
RIIKIFLVEKEPHSIRSYIFYFIVASADWILDFILRDSKPVTLLLFLMLYPYTIYHFKTTLLKCLAVVSVSIGLTGVTKGIVWYLGLSSDLLSQNHVYCSLIPCLLTLALIMVWEYFFPFDKTDAGQTIYHFQIIFIALSSIALCGILISVTILSPVMLSFCLITIYLINILSLLMYSRLNSMQQQELETRTLEQRVIMYQNQFQIMQQSQDELRSLRHDLKNHLLLVEKYLETNKTDSAIQYIQDITQTHDSLHTYINTGNNETDCVFNYLLGMAKQMNCKIQTSVKIPAEPFMPALDLNILISNLLTNAMEALTSCEHKFLSITMKYDRSILYISVYNTYQGTLYRHNNYFLTTKENQNLHGYGFKNIYAIIEKYHGSSSFRTEENIFKADIILYITGKPDLPN